MSVYVCNVASDQNDDVLPIPVMNFDERMQQLKKNVAEKFANRKTSVANSEDDDILPIPGYDPDANVE